MLCNISWYYTVCSGTCHLQILFLYEFQKVWLWNGWQRTKRKWRKLETCKEWVLNEKTEIIQRIIFISSKYTFHPFLLIHINLIKRAKKCVLACILLCNNVCMVPLFCFSLHQNCFSFGWTSSAVTVSEKSICSCAIIYWKLFCFHVTIHLFETKWEMLNVNK